MNKLDKTREEICKDCMFGTVIENCSACIYNTIKDKKKSEEETKDE